MKVSVELNLRLAARVALGLVLLWAGLGKLANLQEFLGQLAAYRLPLPGGVLRLAAVTLPWVELLCGLGLIFQVRLRAALTSTGLLFLAFTVCTGQAWARGLEIACGCLDLRVFGLEPGSASAAWLESVPVAFFRALALGLLACWLWRSGVRRPVSPP